MKDITQKEIIDAFDNCPYKVNLDGIDVCKLNLAPCEKVIDSCNCETLIKLFSTGAQDK